MCVYTIFVKMPWDVRIIQTHNVYITYIPFHVNKDGKFSLTMATFQNYIFEFVLYYYKIYYYYHFFTNILYFKLLKLSTEE